MQYHRAFDSQRHGVAKSTDVVANRPYLDCTKGRAKSSSAEVNYLIVKNGEIQPIEVKSGPSGRLRSLHLLPEDYPNCPGGYVFSSAPYAELPEQKLTFLPLYYAFQEYGGDC